MTDPRQQLHDALDALDAAFAPRTELPVSVGGCTHCYSAADLEALAGPVHQIADDLIRCVAHEAPSHWDDFPGLYRKLTPRTIRFLVADKLNHDMVASWFIAAAWRNWTATECAALEDVWHAWWRSALHSHPSTGDVTHVLETLGVITGTLAPWLTTWAQTRTEAADLHLRDALDQWLIEDELADLHFGFYKELHATPELLPWLLSLEDGRIDADQLVEVVRISSSH
ncbi:hypothetical protein [Streptomyces yunnanensis]|uniref:Uncharacterized protein n=1 Tax=Streptomyces yunnanensis TaxID=156453 RepID=A0A9X8N248_9ACTN|nr:hypothetical protein [Streptomyces yunnanensis]SHM70333.1 hypothetical protein SAMN05216268_113124 [Streptomyces yunnanensis]